MPVEAPYRLTIDLTALRHLGIGLYSNIPAVLSEVVANAWDADASKVEITIDPAGKKIVISDDGCGMTKEEANARYLKIGYDKRRTEGTASPEGRPFMGRKGIGKLSLFSIADVVEVHSVKRHGKSRVEKSGFVMDARKIEEAINAGGHEYLPRPVSEDCIRIARGTTITLRQLKSSTKMAAPFLRRRLARRFSVIGPQHGFSVSVNGEPIGVGDRAYFGKVQYLWCIGKESKKYVDACANAKKHETLDGTIDAGKGYLVTGWVGTLDVQKSVEEGHNTIVVLARGKLVHEDILKDMKEGRLFTKYVIGEIEGDFLDLDEEEDIATSDRQSVKEDDPRFEALRHYLRDTVLNRIGNVWTKWRQEEATTEATQNPKVKEWYESLTPDNRAYAEELFSKIESFPVEDPAYKKELYRHGILAFETLALKQNLGLLDQVSTGAGVREFLGILKSMDELEEAHYYQIAKGRLEVLRKLEDMADTAKERVIQKHIFDHLWLLDPSWERASTDERIERTVMAQFKAIEAKLKPEEKKARIDIRYRTAAGKHIIIELKRYSASVTATGLIDQVRKYRSALEKCLNYTYPGEPHQVEVICILGAPPQPMESDQENRDMLAVNKTRYITYDQLIRQTRDSYRDYLEAQQKIRRIEELVESI